MPARPTTDTVTEVDEGAIAGFSRDVIAAFGEAVARTGLAEQWVEIADRRVRICLAGSALRSYALPALCHRQLDAPGGTADLTIRVFDTASTGVAIPRPVWPKTAYLPTCEISGLGARFLGAFNVGTGTFDLLDIDNGDAVHWIADATDHPPFESSSPFRIIFHWWLRLRGLQFLHGGAVGDAQGGLLLVGRGGTGKSTTAIACLLAGMRFVGDDYVVANRHPHPEVINLYQTAKVHVKDLEHRFPRLQDSVAGRTGTEGGDKAILDLGNVAAGTIVRSLPLRAIVIPKIADVQTPRISRANEHDALTALVPSTVRQLTAVRQQDTDFMVELTGDLPCFHLELGPVVDRVPGALRELLAEV